MKTILNLVLIAGVTIAVAKFTSHMKEGEIPPRTTLSRK
jgi:hypothetical protein